MKNLFLKTGLLYHPGSITQSEREAALRGLKYFERYCVSCEEIDVTKKDSIRNVKRGIAIKEAIYSPAAKINPFDFLFPTPPEAFFDLFRDRDVHGLGLMAGTLFENTADGQVRRIGLSAPKVGAVLSISRFRSLPDAIKLKAIELAAKHEIGHVLGISEHCIRDYCLMQENRDYLDFLNRFVLKELDFCILCSSGISNNVNDLIESKF